MAGFFTQFDSDRIVRAIGDAESRTSAEIRVHVTRRKPKNLEERALRRFHLLGMTKTAGRNGVLIYIAPNARRFHILGQARSMEGTLTLFLVASATMAPALAKLGGLGWHPATAFALIAGTVAAAVEAVSPDGSDNATVPLSVLLTLSFLTEASAQ